MYIHYASSLNSNFWSISIELPIEFSRSNLTIGNVALVQRFPLTRKLTVSAYMFKLELFTPKSNVSPARLGEVSSLVTAG